MGKTRKILLGRANAPTLNRMAPTTHRNTNRETYKARPREKTWIQGQTGLRNGPYPREKRRTAKAKTKIGKASQTHGRQKIQASQKLETYRRGTSGEEIPKLGSSKLLLGRRRRTFKMVRSDNGRP